MTDITLSSDRYHPHQWQISPSLMTYLTLSIDRYHPQERQISPSGATDITLSSDRYHTKCWLISHCKLDCNTPHNARISLPCQVADNTHSTPGNNCSAVLPSNLSHDWLRGPQWLHGRLDRPAHSLSWADIHHFQLYTTNRYTSLSDIHQCLLYTTIEYTSLPNIQNYWI